MRRVCPKCGSTSVIMFDADEDWCTQCKARFPGETTSPHSELTALRAEVSALRLRAETAERERDEFKECYRLAMVSVNDAYDKGCAKGQMAMRERAVNSAVKRGLTKTASMLLALAIKDRP
jgi:hypothetical protein